MSYSLWSVVYGEQPSVSKWNQIGLNDEAIRDGSAMQDNSIAYDHIQDAIPVDFVTIVDAGAGTITTTITTVGTASFTVPTGRTYKALVLAEVGSTGAGSPGAGAESVLYKYTRLDSGSNDFNGWAPVKPQTAGSTTMRYSGFLARVYTGIAAGSHQLEIRTRTISGNLLDGTAGGVVVLVKES